MKFSLCMILFATVSLASEDLNEISGKTGAAVRYGYELLSDTPKYLGPKGKIKSLTKSRMACRNCHIDVGRNPIGNSWLDSHGAYPQYRAREGTIQTLADRVNACMQYPMQGKPIAPESEEMRSILLYMKWIGKGRVTLEKDNDQRLVQISFLNRAASPSRGKGVYQNYCVSCHGPNGEGKLRDDKIAFQYPPLWGNESYIIGSSMSRLSLLARFIKGTMPLTTTKDKPVLSDEDAWDVAAYVNTQKRPPWRDRSPFQSAAEKPFDYPLGPFADEFKLEQHQLGPFQDILDYWKAKQGARAQDTMGI